MVFSNVMMQSQNYRDCNSYKKYNCMSLCEQNFNESNFVLGLSAELYYVREGVINQYALNFVVPVPAHISDLYFTWQSLGPKPVSVSKKYDKLYNHSHIVI